MTDHAEVVRIAEGLDAVPETGADPALIQEAADALRRQSAEIERLRAELEAVRKQEPVAWVHEVYDWPEGATHYQPQQKAFYKRVSACEWYVWSRITDEPLHWSYSPGTMDSAEWIVRAQPAPSVPDIDFIVDQLCEFGHHDIEHGEVRFDRFTLHRGVEAAFAATPEAPKRKPLTDEQIDALRSKDNGKLNFVTFRAFRIIARAVEAAHGIKEQDND